MFKLFTKRKKFSKENLVHQCTLLEKNPKINPRNKQLVIETLRQIAELMIWGDQNDDSFFHIIAERNILGYFLSIIKQKYHRSVTIQVMQTLSIMIQNISKQQSLYYLFSNNYINDLIVHDFDFTDSEILAYYVSFLKTISLKLDDNVINFFFNAKAHDFPLYSEALKFFKNGDQMVRIAVRTLTLNVFGVDDTDLRKFITDKSAVPYFSNLTWFIRDQCIVLNQTLNKAIYGEEQQDDEQQETKKEIIDNDKKTPTNQLQRGVEEQVDHYYYLEDIFLLGLRALSDKLMNQLLSHLVLPVLVGSLVDVDDLVKKQQDILNEYENQMNNIDGFDQFDGLDKKNKSISNIEIGDDDTQKASSIRKFLQRRTRISKQLSLFLLTQVLTVFSDGGLINAIIVALMHPYPPKLVNQIVLKPPQHAVESSIPVAHVLCQKRSYYNNDDLLYEYDENDEKESKRSDLMKDLLENDENAKIQRSRIDSVEKMDIIHEDSKYPEDTNMYRNELLNMLNSDPTQTENEQLIASAAALILTIIRNRSTSEDLLINAGICPQKRKRKRQLFSFNQSSIKNIKNKPNISSSSYATSSLQPDRRDLLPENETTSVRLETKTKTNTNTNTISTISTEHNEYKEELNDIKNKLLSTKQEITDLTNIECHSEPDLSLYHKPNLPLPSPTVPINGDNSSPNHALPSPKQMISSSSSSQRAKSQPPTIHNIESNGYTQQTQQQTQQKHTEQNGNNKILAMTRIRSQSDSDLSVSNNNSTNNSNINTNIKHKNGLKMNTNLSGTANIMMIKTEQQICDYPFEFVECIINVLSQCSKLSVFTIRVLSELLIDFVQDRTMKNNGLNDKHYISLLSVWNGVKLQLSQYLPLQSSAMETYFIDTFEEEWRSVRQQPRIATLVANPIRILPPHVFHGTSTSSSSTSSSSTSDKVISDDSINDKSRKEGKEINSVDRMLQDQQQLIRKLERIRKSIHNFLHISRLKTELLGGSVQLPFIPRTEFQYYYRLQVPLSTIAPGCLNCLVLMQSKKRRRVLFSMREPDWLLLFNRMKGRAGFAMIYMAIPIHSIEGVLNKLDPRVIHLSIRSPVRPHDAAIPISSQKNKWSITLFFDSMFAATNIHNIHNKKDNENNNNNNNNNKEPEVGHKDALTALDYITMNRMRVRRKMMTQISNLVEKDNNHDNDNNNNNT